MFKVRLVYFITRRNQYYYYYYHYYYYYYYFFYFYYYYLLQLFNGTMRGIEAAQSIEGLKKRLDVFYSRVSTIPNRTALFYSHLVLEEYRYSSSQYILSSSRYSSDTLHSCYSSIVGIPFLPLDKYMYLKVHCFVNLVETTFRLAQC